MVRFTTEFKVGLVTLVAIVLCTLLVLRTDDRPDGAIAGYVLTAEFPSAEGIYPSTRVAVAGVSIGSVREVKLEGVRAVATLEMSGQVKLGTDSIAELRAEGILGDRYIRILPGTASELLGDGDVIQSRVGGPDVDALTEQLEDIATDVKAITSSLRDYLEDESTKTAMLATVDNIRALSEDVRALTMANREQVDAIARNLREVSENLNGIMQRSSSALDNELGSLESTLDSLDRTMQQVESIASKIDRGEGTLGALVNDDAPVQQLEEAFVEINDTLEEVGDLVATVSRLRTDIEYHGHVYAGTDAAGFENPVAGAGKNAIGVKLIPRHDYWYALEVVSHPLGTIELTERYSEDLGAVYTEYHRDLDFRISFQFARRFHNSIFRLGLKESSGGAGFDQLLLRDRLVVSFDLYDFTYGSWPVLDGTPNLTIGLRAEPIRHLYVEGGAYNVLFGARHGFATAYAGGGFSFTDDDFKWVVSALPLP